MGGQRLHAAHRGVPAARRPLRRRVRTPPHNADRSGGLHRRQLGRRPGQLVDDAADRPGGARPGWCLTDADDAGCSDPSTALVEVGVALFGLGVALAITPITIVAIVGLLANRHRVSALACSTPSGRPGARSGSPPSASSRPADSPPTTRAHRPGAASATGWLTPWSRCLPWSPRCSSGPYYPAILGQQACSRHHRHNRRRPHPEPRRRPRY